MPTKHADQPSLRVHTETMNGEVVVFVTGALDAASYTVLRDTVAALVLRGVDDLIIEMSACTFMDSAGLTALLEAPRGGTHVRVRNPSAHIDAVLRMVTVATVVDVEVVESPGGSN